MRRKRISRIREIAYAEQLENRLLLSAAPVASEIGEFNTAPASNWFNVWESSEHELLGTNLGAEFIGPLRPRELATRWIVQLTDAAIAELSNSVDATALLRDSISRNVHATRGLGQPGLILVESFTSEPAISALLESSSVVERFEVDSMIAGQFVPNDPLFASLDGLTQINGPAAWDVFIEAGQTVGSADVVVGVLDTGIDLAHRDLYLNIWLNQGEIPSALVDQLLDIDADNLITFRDLNDVANQAFVADRNANGYIDAKDLLADPRWANGFDEDGNNLKDDLVGWDFRNNDNDPSDDHRHGTHVAGTIGAVGNNATDVVGINWQTSMMPLKVLDENNRGISAEAIIAVNYATMMRREFGVNIRVTNNSFVGTDFAPALQEAIASSGEADILFVAAAGNGDIFGDGLNIDDQPRYPAAYELDNVISVTASSSDGDGLASFSNFGSCHVLDDIGDIDCSVDVAAPGVGVVSTQPFGADDRTTDPAVGPQTGPTIIEGGSQFTGSRNGTSMAAPHVTGVAALLLANEPDASAIEVREAILSSVQKSTELDGLVASAGIVDAYAALNALQDAPTAQLLQADGVRNPVDTPMIVTVQYETDGEGDGIDPLSLGDDDLIVTRRGFPNDRLRVEFVEACWFRLDTCNIELPLPDGVDLPTGVVRAAYRIYSPDSHTDLGFSPGWKAIDNGDYLIDLKSTAVRSRNGVGNRATTLYAADESHSFQVAVNDPRVIFLTTQIDEPWQGVSQGELTLRSAIQAANTLDNNFTIVLPPGVYRLDEAGADEDDGSSGDLDVKGSLSIIGSGLDTTIIDGGDLDRVLHAHSGSVLRISGVTILGGRAKKGAGIYSEDALLEISQSSIQSNMADDEGGGIWSDGDLRLVDTTVDANIVTSPLAAGGAGIFSSGSLSVRNSTISNNLASSGFLISGGGGGVYIGGSDDGGGVSAEFVNTTISGNQATSGNGGGVYQASGNATYVHTTVANNVAMVAGGGIWISDRSTANVGHSILAGNIANSQPDIAGPFLSRSNLIGVASTGAPISSQLPSGTAANPLDPKLGPLSDNGGFTQTHVPLAGSPAIKAALPHASSLMEDQRGIARPTAAAARVALGAVQKHFVEIRGRLFHDIDGDGERGANEQPLSEWVVYADLNQNATLDPGEPNTITRLDDPATPQVNESEYVISGLDPVAGQISVRTIPRSGFVDSTPIVVNADQLSGHSQDADPFSGLIAPTEPAEPVFHLDFSVPADGLRDISDAQIPIQVGAAVSTIDGGGPILENGRHLDAGRWAGAADDSNQILLLDHPTLDGAARSAGSIVTWIRVEDETEWNGIVLTRCDDNDAVRFNCDEYSRSRGLEFQANLRSGVFGSVQGWSTNNFGPRHATNGGSGGSETSTNVWTHVALTWNDVGDHTIYVNGVQGRTIEGVGTEPFGLNDPLNWSIGGDDVELGVDNDDDDNQRRLRGDLADFAIFNTELNSQSINDIIRNGVPVPAEKIFHLDFSSTASELADVSANQLPVRVGTLIETVSRGGPTLENGTVLDSGKWLDVDDDQNHIDILDHPVLDDVSRSAGSIVTWVKVENDNHWNNILKTQCTDWPEPCAEFGQTRGFELHADRSEIGGVWGAVQGWAKQSFGPSVEIQGPGGTETPSGVWTHIALTWNDRGDHATYVNGVPGRRVLGVGVEAFGLNDTGDWSIGGDRTDVLHGLVGDPNSRRLHGELADFAIFDGELDRLAINTIMRSGVPVPKEPVFHLDFRTSSELLRDVASNLPIEVGTSVSTRPTGGPVLDTGTQLASARWAGTNDDENEILIKDNPILDRVSRQAGAVVTWVKVDDQNDWNGILKSRCESHALPCNTFSPTRGFELAVNSASGTFGAVQGYNTSTFGPAHATNQGPGGAETPTGVWTHVALTWNAFGDHRLFVNGIPGATVDGVGSETFGLNDLRDWSIGGDGLSLNVPTGDTNQRRLQGELADFAIYDLELSAGDVREIMTRGVRQPVPGIHSGVQTLERFGNAPSIVGERIVFEDHLGRVQLSDGITITPLVGLNTVSTDSQPFADGESISFDGEFVAFTGRLGQIGTSEQVVNRSSGIFVVDQFGVFQELVNQSSVIPGLDSVEDQTFENKTFEVHSISNEVVAFGAREPDRTDTPTGRVLARGVNEQGLYVATRSGDIVVLVDNTTLVPGTDQTFETFGEAQLDETTLGLFGAFEATFAAGFGIYEKRGAGPLSVVIDHTTPLPGGDPLTAIESFAFSNSQVVFHGIGTSREGIYLSNEDGVSVLADRSTSIPADMGRFQSFGEVAFDKGNAVFVGRGRSFELASKQNLHQQVGIYVSLNGRLEKVVDMQSTGQPAAFAGRMPVELSIGPEAISGNRVVFYAAFSDGTDGIFTVEFDSQSRHDVSLSPGILISDLDFGRRPLPGQIRGQSYNDINRNGRRDVDEPGLPGWIVYLDENRNGLFDTGEPSTATGETGEYRFTDLPALRNYTVRQAPQANWVESASFGSQYQFFLDANERRNDLDFGNRATAIDGQGGSGKIYVEVFDDRNANGERDSDEGLRVGRDLYIDVNNNGIFDRGIDASPQIVGDVYEFSELAMVSHEIRLRRTDGLEQTSPLGNSFDTFTKSNVGDRPTAVVTGHFDDDDFVDLVVGNNTSNTLTFLSNANSPAAVTSAIDHRGNGPIAMVVDDFDRDGRLDLAVANFHSSDVSVLLGKGDGTFQNAAVYSVGEKAGPVAIATAYLNDDSFPDLVVSNSSSDSITLLTNSGTGGFRATHLTIGIGDRPQGIIAGKFTSDDFDDMIVVTQNDNAVRFVLNNGNKTFTIGQAIAVEARPSAIVAGDFDGDGLLDFAVANISTASVSVLFGTGDGQFERKQNIRVDASPIALAQVDIDSDNDVDIVFTRGGDLPVSLLRNDGTGHFQSSAFGGAADFFDVSALPFSISASDINGDGVVDLVLANRDSDSVTLFENRIVAGSHRVTLGTNQPEQSVSFGIVLEVIRDLPGDMNQDGAVNFGDFLIFSQNFGQQNVGWIGGDFDEDGVVTFFDFLVFSANFGRSLNAAPRS